jgi:hypothetical protein
MAIAYDTSVIGMQSAGTTLTFAHTCSGSNRILFVDFYWSASRTVSSVTYAGQAMTQVVAPLDTGSGERHGMYYIIAPSTGANNVVLTLSGSTDIVGIASSYTGADQSSPIDATRTETNLETGTTYAEAITSVADNCWAIWGTREYAGRAITAGANTALRQRESTIYGIILADSNQAITPAGSYTMNLNADLSGNWFSDILATFKPATAVSSGTGFTTLLGIGN